MADDDFVERPELPPDERPDDLVADERELEAFVPEDFVARAPDDFVPDDFVERAPDDFVPEDLVERAPDDLAAVDLAAVDLVERVPDDLVPDDFVDRVPEAALVPDDLVERAPELFVPDDLVLDDRALAALVPEDFAPELLVPELFVPEERDEDLADALLVPPLERELLRAEVPPDLRAVVEDFVPDERVREPLPLRLDDELPPVFSLVFLSSVGMCRLLLALACNRHACKATSLSVVGSKQRPVSKVVSLLLLPPVRVFAGPELARC